MDQKTNVQTEEVPSAAKDFWEIVKTFIIVILILALLFGIIVMGFTLYWYNNVMNEDAWGAETSYWTTLFKDHPDYEIENSKYFWNYDDITIHIDCDENYKFVTFKFCLYDEDGNIIKQFFITENNLIKGEKYSFTYSLYDYITVRDIQNAKKAKCVVHEYK